MKGPIDTAEIHGILATVADLRIATEEGDLHKQMRYIDQLRDKSMRLWNRQYNATYTHATDEEASK